MPDPIKIFSVHLRCDHYLSILFTWLSKKIINLPYNDPALSIFILHGQNVLPWGVIFTLKLL